MGMGVSHGPTVVLPAQMWAERAATEVHATERNLNTLDGRFLTYAELLAERGEPFAREATLGNFQLQFVQCQRALDRLADDLATARPDVLVVIGSDQDELYRDGNVPARQAPLPDLQPHQLAVVHNNGTLVQAGQQALAALAAWAAEA